jgi:hypothetical protein
MLFDIVQHKVPLIKAPYFSNIAHLFMYLHKVTLPAVRLARPPWWSLMSLQ